MWSGSPDVITVVTVQRSSLWGLGLVPSLLTAVLPEVGGLESFLKTLGSVLVGAVGPGCLHFLGGHRSGPRGASFLLLRTRRSHGLQEPNHISRIPLFR